MSPTSLIPVLGSSGRVAHLLGALGLAFGSVLAGLMLGGSPAQAATGHHVVIKQYAYSPAALSITAGDSVTWTNEDSVAHDVHVTSGPATFASPMLSQGQSWTYRFAGAGTYSYICSVHPDMTATVTVAPAPVAHPATAHHAAGVTKDVVTKVGVTPTSQKRSGSSARAATTRRPATRPVLSAAAPQAVAPATTASLASPTSTTASLDPLLIVAGFSTAVVVFCLLLMTARPEPVVAATGARTPLADAGAHAAEPAPATTTDTMVDHRVVTSVGD